jgi:hypothetical protein
VQRPPRWLRIVCNWVVVAAADVPLEFCKVHGTHKAEVQIGSDIAINHIYKTPLVC